MTAQANLKSDVITNLDASPVVRPSVGSGAPGALKSVSGRAGPTTDGATTGGVLRMVRVPSNCSVQSIDVCQDAATTTATFNIGLYYSDTGDGTSPVNQGLVIDDGLFASSLDTHALVQWTNQTFRAGHFTPLMVRQPLWQAAGLSKDPGGFFDITMTNTATISGAATVNLRCQYQAPGS